MIKNKCLLFDSKSKFNILIPQFYNLNFIGFTVEKNFPSLAKILSLFPNSFNHNPFKLPKTMMISRRQDLLDYRKNFGKMVVISGHANSSLRWKIVPLSNK